MILVPCTMFRVSVTTTPHSSASSTNTLYSHSQARWFPIIRKTSEQSQTLFDQYKISGLSQTEFAKRHDLLQLAQTATACLSLVFTKHYCSLNRCDHFLIVQDPINKKAPILWGLDDETTFSMIKLYFTW